MSEEATHKYEQARRTVQRFVNAYSWREIVFVRGTTEAINLVANCFARGVLREGDEIIVSEMEHHSNIVPWQLACQQSGAKLKVLPINDRGELIMEKLPELITRRTRIIAVNHVSNSLGTVNPIKEIVGIARQAGVPVLVDGAQAVAHLPVDVQELGCDFYAFSGHKIYAPTGIGVLYAREEWLEKLPPYQGGGDMIREVTFEKTTYNELPYKFEAGTPNIADAVALASALEFVERVGWNYILAHEKKLLQLAQELLSEVPSVRLIGKAKDRCAVVSFVSDRVHPHDIGTFLDSEAIAIRTGHHCTQPVMRRFGIPATARASFAIYNTEEEVRRLAVAVRKAIEFFG